ncbi:MAG: hypothetical protein EBS19_04215 [Spirochaetia bacterium]|nr:hypothetical protein [Spirochaetia bacterium]
METSPRIFDSEIIITPNSKWIFRGNEITLDSVLKYFKENLSEDEKGVFITNRYGELSEKGYVTLEGFALKIIGYEEEGEDLYLIGDNSQKLSLDEIEFHADFEKKLYIRKKTDKFLKYFLTRDPHSKIANFLEEEGDDFFIHYGKWKKKVIQD